MKRLFLSIVLCCLLSQNQAHTRVEVLDQEQMVEILVDLELAKAWVHTIENTDEQALGALFKTKSHQIYQDHDTDEVTFKHSYLHYLSRTEVMISIYDRVISQLEGLWTRA
jgi:hypothetical protein